MSVWKWRIKFDTIKREAYANGTLVSLTRKENGILEYLLLHLGRPVSQEELIEHVWDAPWTASADPSAYICLRFGESSGRYLDTIRF